MKFKKPEIVPMFRTSSGVVFETLKLWKKSELEHLLAEVYVSNTAPADIIAGYLIAHDEAFVAILGIVERRGRPQGAKDKKPRKKAATTIQHNETGA